MFNGYCCLKWVFDAYGKEVITNSFYKSRYKLKKCEHMYISLPFSVMRIFEESYTSNYLAPPWGKAGEEFQWAYMIQQAVILLKKLNFLLNNMFELDRTSAQEYGKAVVPAIYVFI